MNHKQDIRIGYRAYEELTRVSNEMGVCKHHLIRMLKLPKTTLYNYANGGTPSALNLAKLHYVGADVIYILTGKRSK